jgi:parvulin-like peptidyl-prolyl isomerase
MSNLIVNGVSITAAAVRAESARLRQEASQSGREISLDEALHLSVQAEQLLIERVLLDREAKRLGIVVLPRELDRALAQLLPRAPATSACRADLQTAELRADIERRVRVDKLVDFWTKGLAPPGTKIVRQFYAEHRGQFRVLESICVEQIVKNVYHEDERGAAREALDLVADELARGADFSALAAAQSDCPEQGGALGFIARGEMVPEFDEVVFHLPLNRPSPVFETRFGFHIAKVSQHRAAGVLPFSEAAPRISHALLNLAKERELESRLNSLRSQASIRRVTVG